jgi:hypothetical protein
MSSTRSNWKFGLLAAVVLPLAGLVPGCAAPPAENHSATSATGATSEKQITLRQDMRKLWEDHITWTRLVIVSTAAGLPDANATTARLLQNQTDIGDAMKPFYGDSAGIRLTALLHDHIIGAANVLTAAKANDQKRLAAAKTAWYANADSIAAFLSGANPGAWTPAATQEMMKEHLDLTLAEAVDQLQGRYPDSVVDYDKVRDAILKMADMLSSGIIRQFPDKF